VHEYGMQGDDCPMFVATRIWGLRDFAKESRNMHASIGRDGIASLMGWRGWLCGSNVSSDSSPRSTVAQPIRKLVLAKCPMFSTQ
jgi:hypothetical protein